MNFLWLPPFATQYRALNLTNAYSELIYTITGNQRKNDKLDWKHYNKSLGQIIYIPHWNVIRPNDQQKLDFTINYGKI